MKSLIVEDDFTARKLMQIYLSELGETDIAINGKVAIKAFKSAYENNDRYDLICLDIMMPEMNGVECLGKIRKIETKRGIKGLDGTKVIMTTAKDRPEDIFGAFREGCEAYIIKPIQKEKLYGEIEKLGLPCPNKVL